MTLGLDARGGSASHVHSWKMPSSLTALSVRVADDASCSMHLVLQLSVNSRHLAADFRMELSRYQGSYLLERPAGPGLRGRTAAPGR